MMQIMLVNLIVFFAGVMKMSLNSMFIEYINLNRIFQTRAVKSHSLVVRVNVPVMSDMEYLLVTVYSILFKDLLHKIIAGKNIFC